MHTHLNARLKALSLERLLRRHIDGGEPLKALAAQACISLRSAYKWLARYRSVVTPLWRIDGVLAASSDGRSILIN